MKRLFCIMVGILLTVSSVFAGGNSQKSSSSSAGGQTGPVTFSIWIDHPWFWFDQYGKDDVAKKITELTGVTLNMTRAVDGSQLPVMIASGNLPDLVYTDNGNAALALQDSAVCWAMDELVSRYNININASAVEIKNNTAPDGHYYTIKNAFVPQAQYDSGAAMASPGTAAIAYRTDIYEAIGSPPLNTLDDLEKALLAAKAKYPDVIPLMNEGSMIGWFSSYFFKQLGIPYAGVQFDGKGGVIHLSSNPNLIKFFELANRFYREGLISKEVQTYNYEKFTETRNSGRSFMQVRSSAEAQEANAAQRDSGGQYRWKLLSHNLGGSDMIISESGTGWSGFYITKKNKNPQRALAYFGWHRSEENRKLASWGIQGKHWDYNAQGRTVYLNETKNYLASGGNQADLGIGVWIFGDQGEERSFKDYSTTDQNLLDVYSFLTESAKIIKVQPELSFVSPKEGDMQILFRKIDNMFGTALNEIAFAETNAAMRAAYNRMTAQAASLGAADLEKWMTSSYKALGK